MGKGGFEYEQWATWQKHKENETRYDRLELRHEFEFGLTDSFDLAIYLPSWRYDDTNEHAGTRFGSVDVEGVAYLANPVTDRVGLGLYNEVRVGEDELDFEHKLLVQKDIGKWILLYNLVLETEIEGVFNGGEENEVKGVLGHTMGVGYAVAPGWFLGAEGGCRIGVRGLVGLQAHHRLRRARPQLPGGPVVGDGDAGLPVERRRGRVGLPVATDFRADVLGPDL